MAAFEAAYFDSRFFDTGEASPPLGRVIFGDEPIFADDRTTQRGKPWFGNPNDRYK